MSTMIGNGGADSKLGDCRDSGFVKPKKMKPCKLALRLEASMEELGQVKLNPQFEKTIQKDIFLGAYTEIVWSH